MSASRTPRRGRAAATGKPKRKQRPEVPAVPLPGTDEPDGESRALLGDDPEQRAREPGPNAEGSVEDPLHDWPEDD